MCLQLLWRSPRRPPSASEGARRGLFPVPRAGRARRRGRRALHPLRWLHSDTEAPDTPSHLHWPTNWWKRAPGAPRGSPRLLSYHQEVLRHYSTPWGQPLLHQPLPFLPALRSSGPTPASWKMSSLGITDFPFELESACLATPLRSHPWPEKPATYLHSCMPCEDSWPPLEVGTQDSAKFLWKCAKCFQIPYKLNCDFDTWRFLDFLYLPSQSGVLLWTLWGSIIRFWCWHHSTMLSSQLKPEGGFLGWDWNRPRLLFPVLLTLQQQVRGSQASSSSGLIHLLEWLPELRHLLLRSVVCVKGCDSGRSCQVAKVHRGR